VTLNAFGIFAGLLLTAICGIGVPVLIALRTARHAEERETVADAERAESKRLADLAAAKAAGATEAAEKLAQAQSIAELRAEVERLKRRGLEDD
jgi:hypothetical protein